MRSIRNFVAVAGAVLLLGLLPAAAAASSAKGFHLTKDCDVLTCVVTSSTYRGIPAGTVINYTENSDGSLTSVISTATGSATGRCVLDPIFGDPSLPGTCVFSTGTGSLRQFHLSVDVNTVDFVSWSWDGTYWFGNGD
ncbi:MAG: hypothetical protein HY264_11825 [Chloroflexi bacterium]|nr:hypothetical protein [Chloroflexota bacterium]